jgi:outer membrane receptor protein involved in Fe transport
MDFPKGGRVMSKFWRFLVFGTIALLPFAAPLAAQPAAGEESTQEEGAQPEDKFDEVISVTASKYEQRLNEVPAAISILDERTLEELPADDYGDLLRNVPGLNVSQISARDIQITGRTASGSLSTSELVLLDGRTLYLDFFGFVMWDYVPMDTNELKQIEVVRGPGSAVWGANAMSGVINLITKSPREMQGTSVTLGGGDFGTLYGNVTHAGANERYGYKVSGGYYEQDPFNRPTGVIPGTVGPTNPLGTAYPSFANQGTSQPKANLRFDFDQSLDSTWGLDIGYAATDGIMHSGIGPFDIASGASMSSVKVNWARRAARATFFVNLLDGDAVNLLSRDITGQPIQFAFASDTYNLDFTNTEVFGESNIFTFGATARTNQFDLSIAPQGDARDEYGVFLQDEILIGEKVRWLIGARLDDIDPIDTVVSPRTSLLFSPTPRHTFRASFNRAFRAPSLINNFLDVTIINEVGPLAPGFPPGVPVNPNDVLAGLVAAGLVPAGVPCQFVLTTCTPFFYNIVPVDAVGNPLATQEELDAFELGYVGQFDNGITFTISVYRNETADALDFFQRGVYTSLNPPANWPLGLLATGTPLFPPQLDGLLPSEFSYRNIGEILDEGVEISLNGRPSATFSWFLNYSYQAEPEATGIDQETLPNGTVRDPINSPPQNRVNAGFSYSGGRYFFSANANYQDDAYWTDVLDSRFWGPTDAFTQVNVSAGLRFAEDRSTLSVNVQNVFDEEVLQHVFGDRLEQKITAQLLFRF